MGHFLKLLSPTHRREEIQSITNISKPKYSITRSNKTDQGTDISFVTLKIKNKINIPDHLIHRTDMHTNHMELQVCSSPKVFWRKLIKLETTMLVVTKKRKSKWLIGKKKMRRVLKWWDNSLLHPNRWIVLLLTHFLAKWPLPISMRRWFKKLRKFWDKEWFQIKSCLRMPWNRKVLC